MSKQEHCPIVAKQKKQIHIVAEDVDSRLLL